tara:strand:- start:812 stop:1867 length:1056 start_codon:yes stop_codon:yes gene_type:complete
MANKKISQLNRVDGAIGISSADLFPIASGGGGDYQTASVAALDIASFCLSPMPASQINQPIGFTGNVDINFHKTNWVDSSAAVPSTHAFLMVNRTNGQLTTGSGIASTVGGDNMGDCVATQDVFMQGYDITGANLVGLGSVYGNGTDRSRIFTDLANYGNELTVIGYTDLTLSGNDHVHISGQALSLENGDTQTPISGNVIITGGNVEIDPANKLIVNQISGYALGADNALLTLEGASTHVPFSNGSTEVDWSNSNIQYKTHSDGTSLNYDFSQVADGQTLTLYFQNTHNSTAITPKFRSGVFGPDTAGAVRWGAEYSNEAPAIAANKTNLYTFVRMNTGIFASAVTGYVY